MQVHEIHNSYFRRKNWKSEKIIQKTNSAKIIDSDTTPTMMFVLTLSALFMLIPTSLCPPVTPNTSSSLSPGNDMDNPCGYGLGPYPACVCVKPYINKDDKKCSYKGKSKLTAFLLSAFVGILGVDWFYLSAGNAGYIIAGIFKLITGGGFGIWCAVDLIRILADSFPDGNGMELYGDF